MLIEVLSDSEERAKAVAQAWARENSTVAMEKIFWMCWETFLHLKTGRQNRLDVLFIIQRNMNGHALPLRGSSRHLWCFGVRLCSYLEKSQASSHTLRFFSAINIPHSQSQFSFEGSSPSETVLHMPAAWLALHLIPTLDLASGETTRWLTMLCRWPGHQKLACGHHPKQWVQCSVLLKAFSVPFFLFTKYGPPSRSQTDI